MNERINPFAGIADTSVFTVKPKQVRPIEDGAIAQLAEDNNFPSRQAKKAPKVEKRKPRIYRTGRNIQFNAKLTAETTAKIYKAAEDKNLPLGKILELAMDAYERERGP